MTEIQNIYVVDTSSFVELGKLPQDILPFIWNQIVELIKEYRFITHFEVKREILEYYKDDPIKDWVVQVDRRYHFVKDPTFFQGSMTGEIQKKYPFFVDTDTDKPHADPCLIVQMIELEQGKQKTFADCEKNYFLVTEETESSDRKNYSNPVEVTKLTDFCRVYNINFLKFWGMVRNEGWQWKE